MSSAFGSRTSRLQFQSLPTECRPLLVRTAVLSSNYDSSASDNDDDSDDTITTTTTTNNNNFYHTLRGHTRETGRQQALSSAPASNLHETNNNTATTSASTVVPNAASTSPLSTDWLNIARHTLRDVTRSLPVARNTEIRLKTTADAVTKIELARQKADEPSLHHQRYKLPHHRKGYKEADGAVANLVSDGYGDDGDHDNLAAGFYLGGKDQTVYEEAVRVRNSLEIIATRIRDAIAQDVKSKLLRQQHDEFLSRKEKKIQDQQAEQIADLSSQIRKLQNDADDLNDRLADSVRLRQDLVASEKRQREQDGQMHRDQFEELQQKSQLQRRLLLLRIEELEDRNAIELSCLEEMLRQVVLEQQQNHRFASEQRDLLDEQERNERQRQHQQHAFQALLDKQRQEIEDKKNHDNLEDCARTEGDTRQLLESIALAELEFHLEIFSDETNRIVERIERQEAEQDELDDLTHEAFEAERKRWAQERNESIDRLFANNVISQLESDFEPSARDLIHSWEQDQRSLLCQDFFKSEASKINKAHEASRQIKVRTCQSKFFHIWSCWALMKREENFRLDRERHNRIVDSALYLQQSQMDTAMDSLMTFSNCQNQLHHLRDDDDSYFHHHPCNRDHQSPSAWSVDNTHIHQQEENFHHPPQQQQQQQKQEEIPVHNASTIDNRHRPQFHSLSRRTTPTSKKVMMMTPSQNNDRSVSPPVRFAF